MSPEREEADAHISLALRYSADSEWVGILRLTGLNSSLPTGQVIMINHRNIVGAAAEEEQWAPKSCH